MESGLASQYLQFKNLDYMQMARNREQSFISIFSFTDSRAMKVSYPETHV